MKTIKLILCILLLYSGISCSSDDPILIELSKPETHGTGDQGDDVGTPEGRVNATNDSIVKTKINY